jgi:hypothetical protein
MTWFVCSVVGGDAGEDLKHIITRKEAERSLGAGEFWWGLGAALGPAVEAKAQLTGGTLPALFSASTNSSAQSPVQVRIWDGWSSRLDLRQRGRIPGHVVVTSGFDPKKKERAHYALICHADHKLRLGHNGFCDLSQCKTGKNLVVDYLQGAALLFKPPPLIAPSGTRSRSCRSIAFEAGLFGHCYVKLEDPRVLTQSEWNSLRQYNAGDDWRALAKTLRR